MKSVMVTVDRQQLDAGRWFLLFMAIALGVAKLGTSSYRIDSEIVEMDGKVSFWLIGG